MTYVRIYTFPKKKDKKKIFLNFSVFSNMFVVFLLAQGLDLNRSFLFFIVNVHVFHLIAINKISLEEFRCYFNQGP